MSLASRAILNLPCPRRVRRALSSRENTELTMCKEIEVIIQQVEHWTYLVQGQWVGHYAVLWLVFRWSPHPWSPVEITPVLTTFCGYYPCVHYIYVQWLIMTSQWVMTLLRMPHCGTTMSNDIARDVHYDVSMDNDIAMNLLCYVLLHQIMLLLFHQ